MSSSVMLCILYSTLKVMTINSMLIRNTEIVLELFNLNTHRFSKHYSVINTFISSEDHSKERCNLQPQITTNKHITSKSVKTISHGYGL